MSWAPLTTSRAAPDPFAELAEHPEGMVDVVREMWRFSRRPEFIAASARSLGRRLGIDAETVEAAILAGAPLDGRP